MIVVADALCHCLLLTLTAYASTYVESKQVFPEMIPNADVNV